MKNYKNFPDIVAGVLLLLLSLIVMFPAYFYGTIFSGLDASWQISLHLAWEKGFVFGRDFLFTYGPLGIMSSRYAFPGMATLYIISDFLLYALIVFSFVYTFRKFPQKMIIGGVLLLLTCSIPQFWHGLELSVSLLLLSMFFFLMSIYTEKLPLLSLTASCLLSVYSFYVKLNTGLFSGLLIITSLLIILLSKEKRTFALQGLGILFGFYLISFLIMPIDVMRYIKGGWFIASAYSEAMVIPIQETPHVFSLSIIFLGCLFLFLAFSLRHVLSSKEHFLQIFWLLSTLFLLFKQAFVRADAHVFAFLNWMPAPVAIVLLFSKENLKKGLQTLFILSLVFSFGASEDRLQYDAFVSRLNGIKEYFSYFSMPQEEALKKTNQAIHTVFSPSTMDLIGTSSVDIIPVDIQYLFRDNKNYHPRPVMQSYSAYHPYLDALNASTYQSKDGPQYVLFKIGTVDGRYPFFDESLTKTTLLTHYEPVTRDGEYTLLKQRDHPEDFIRNDFSTERRAFNEWIPVSKSKELVFARIELKYSLLGELAKMFFQPPVPRVTFKFEDGSREEYRAVASIIKGDVLVSKFITSQDDAESFFKREFNALKRVKEIKFSTPESWAWKPRFTVVLSEGHIQ